MTPEELVSPEYVDDHLASNILARQKELFHYKFDRDMFTEMYANATDDDFKNDLARRINEIDRQMMISQSVLDALLRRVRNPEAHAAALARVNASASATQA